MLRVGSAATVVAWIFSAMATISATVSAHRLDEYLQAIRIDLGLDRLRVEVALTPGFDVFQSVIVTLDGNGDGEIAEAESEGYARLVLSHLRLTVDGEPRPLTLVSRQVPAVPDLAAGTGVIRIEATATNSTDAAGRHRLELHNDFRPDVGVYLVNALIPSTTAIRITGQQRDPLQRMLTLDYEIVRSPGVTTVLSWCFVVAAIIGIAVWRRGGIKKIKI